jgi:hypothetical protein
MLAFCMRRVGVLAVAGADWLLPVVGGPVVDNVVFFHCFSSSELVPLTWIDAESAEGYTIARKKL